MQNTQLSPHNRTENYYISLDLSDKNRKPNGSEKKIKFPETDHVSYVHTSTQKFQISFNIPNDEISDKVKKNSNYYFGGILGGTIGLGAATTFTSLTGITPLLFILGGAWLGAKSLSSSSEFSQYQELNLPDKKFHEDLLSKIIEDFRKENPTASHKQIIEHSQKEIENYWKGKQ